MFPEACFRPKAERKKERTLISLDLDEKRRSYLSEGFVLKAQARLRRTFRRKKEEAFGLGVSKGSLV